MQNHTFTDKEKMKKEYEICKVRKHQKSILRSGEWDICMYCGTSFRYVTKLEELNAPE